MFSFFNKRSVGVQHRNATSHQTFSVTASGIRKIGPGADHAACTNRVGAGQPEASTHGTACKATTPARKSHKKRAAKDEGATPRGADRLASHQITLSGGSDDDNDAATTPLRTASLASQRAGSLGGASQPAANGRTAQPRRTPLAPAAALATQVVSTARRRARKQSATAAPGATPTSHGFPLHAASDATASARAPLAEPAAAQLKSRSGGEGGGVRVRQWRLQGQGQRWRPGQRGGGDGGELTARWKRSSTVPWVTVLLMAAVVAAAAAVVIYPGTLAAAVLGGVRHVISSRADEAKGSYGVGPPVTAAGSSVTATGAGGGHGGRGAASSSARSTWLHRAMPYMSGAAWLRGGGGGGRGGGASRALSAAARAGAGAGPALAAWGWVAPARSEQTWLPALAAAAAGGLAADGAGDPAGVELEWRESATVRVITVTSGGSSPYRTTWDALAAHSAQRLEWTDPSYQMLVFQQEQLAADKGVQEAFVRALQGGAHMVVGLDVTDPGAEAFLKDPRVSAKLPGVVLFAGSSAKLTHDLTQLPGGLRPQDAGSWRTALARKLTWTPDGVGLAVWDTVQLLLGRHDSDNFLFVYLVLINQYVTAVPQVADTTKGFDLQSLFCMIKNCGSKVVGCVQDPTCKSALDCLNSCTFNDQVCQYRCIVSHESPLLEQFSLCILQLHNCRNLDAKPPLLPDPAAMAAFRGTPLTHEAAEDLFIGWLDQPAQGAPRGAHLGDRPGKRFSWLVAGGKNPAYDYFPCQHQLYYRGKGRGQMWYEPIFKAITLDGREVWRRRVYRVRRGKVPGTFHLSVLDNGVTSNEFWRILDCDDDLAYCLFYYSGAASTAGLSYSGAVLGTPDGRMPGPQHTGRLHTALRRAGIEPWELSYVDNSDCASAPLQITGPVPLPV